MNEQEKLTRLREALEAARRPHYVNDGDCWYSCPLAMEDRWHSGMHSRCCDDDAIARGTCTCGADEHNAKIEAALTETA